MISPTREKFLLKFLKCGDATMNSSFFSNGSVSKNGMSYAFTECLFSCRVNWRLLNFLEKLFSFWVSRVCSEFCAKIFCLRDISLSHFYV